MITGYLYDEAQGLRTTRDLAEARAAIDDGSTVLWLDVEAEDEDVHTAIGALFGLNPGAVDDADDKGQRPRIDDYGDYLFLLMYASLAPEDPPSFAPRQLAIFFGRRFLITIHDQPIRAIRTACDRLVRMPERALGRGLDYHLFHIIDYLVDNFVVCAESYEEILDDLDEASMRADVKSGLLADLTEVQRRLIRMRRMASAQRELAAQIAGGEYEFISPEVDRRFEHIYQHLTHAFELIEGMRETIHAIRDNYYAILAERTNQMMRTLTMFSTFILPLTLITGFYGMNVGLWPPGDSPLALLSIVGLMIASGGCMVLYFKRRNWL